MTCAQPDNAPSDEDPIWVETEEEDDEEMTEERMPIYPAEWLCGEPELPKPSGTALQDGLLKAFQSVPTDWKATRAAETEPFDFKELMKTTDIKGTRKNV